MASELKPCPFCGGKASIERKGDRRMSTIYSCDWCGCSLETGEEWDHGKAWNTRPAPAATDTRLVTVGYMADYEGVWIQVGELLGSAVVPRSQAEELLAAERAEKEIAERNRDAARENFLTMQKSAAKILERTEKAEAIIAMLNAQIEIRDQGVDALSKRIEKAEADNAAKDARIKELDAAWLSAEKQCQSQGEQFAAAEKVRKAAEHVIWFDWSDNDDDAVKAVSDLRAVLEGKPYKCEWQQRAETAETKLAATEKAMERLAEFANSFHITVVDNFYKDVTLHLDAPHSLSIRIPNDSTKSFIFKDLEERRRAVLGGKP